jgi:hypothetical protein
VAGEIATAIRMFAPGKMKLLLPEGLDKKAKEGYTNFG